MLAHKNSPLILNQIQTNGYCWYVLASMLFRKLLRLVLGISIHFSQLTAVHSAYLTFNACISYLRSLCFLWKLKKLYFLLAFCAAWHVHVKSNLKYTGPHQLIHKSSYTDTNVEFLVVSLNVYVRPISIHSALPLFSLNRALAQRDMT